MLEKFQIPDCCKGFYHTKTQTVAIGPVSPPTTRHFNLTTLAPIKYLCSDCIMTWSIHGLCSIGRSSSSCCQICDPSNILRVAIENPRISHQIWCYFTAIQRILVASQIWMREAKELVKLHNLCIDHVAIWSELKKLIVSKVLPKV